ncbi:hypothetical protein GF396_03975 [Candidatus Pacearchaeota archaeon]|nr:hypothetical protein [Candidatus Pacearchaeota archaeon]
MQRKTINEISEIYELELEKIIKNIKRQKAKKTLLQFPEGLKPHAQEIADYIESQTKTNCFIWLDTCYGACDIPIEAEKLVDLVIQFGHTPWKFKNN